MDVATTLRGAMQGLQQFRRMHPWRAASILAVVMCGLLLESADLLFPPDMTRYNQVSPEVVARDGTLLRPYLSRDGYWRLKTTAPEVSPRYLALLKLYEDKRFDTHWGVDPLATARAALQYASAGHVVSGGSTLSMQAARLLQPPGSRGLGTKLVQMIRALQLEERYSKNEILSIYLTLAPFGGNIEGVRAASLSYFGKEPRALSLAECAMLVALPQSPAKLRLDRHPKAAFAGRDKVLSRMLRDGALTANDVSLARREILLSARLPMPMHAPHLADRIKQRTREPRVQTMLDAGLQLALERLGAREMDFLEGGANMAALVVDNKTRDVIAYLGGTSYWGSSGQVDLAQRPRSPGSALKPFIYGLAFDDLILHPSTVIEDQAQTFGDYAPKDFSGAFQGSVTVRDALRMSLNVPAVMVLDRIGPLRFTLALQNAGADLAFPAHDSTPTLPVALGGLGISLADITMLYAGIADAGSAKPLLYTFGDKPGASHRLFGPAAAWYLRDILSGVALPEGWAMGQGLSRRRVAFKTGTSYGFRDAWSIGFSNDYTVGVWVGRPDGAPRADSVGREAAGPILLKIFELLPRDHTPDPVRPAGVLSVQSTEALPQGLRVFTREVVAAQPTPANISPPSISFPPNGAAVPLAAAAGTDRAIALKADGGREPLTWMVDGQLVGTFDRFTPALYTPAGQGFARVTVVDAEGRSDTARVRFVSH